MEQSFVTRRFAAAVLVLAAMNLLASPPEASWPPAVVAAVLGALAGSAVIVAIAKALYLGARRFVAAVTSDA